MKDCLTGVKTDLLQALIPAGSDCDVKSPVKKLRPTANAVGRKRRNTDDEY